MPSIDQIIAGINKRKLYSNFGQRNDLTCSCRDTQCNFEGKCNAKDVVYLATLPDSINNISYKYIGMTSEEIRKRVTKHKQSFKNIDYKGETSLSRKV